MYGSCGYFMDEVVYNQICAKVTLPSATFLHRQDIEEANIKWEKEKRSEKHQGQRWQTDS